VELRGLIKEDVELRGWTRRCGTKRAKQNMWN